jgi:hemerythrin-like domain-containing protein
MNDPMTILKADHREAKKLLTALGESEEGPERDKMAAELEAALTLHMQIEEDILYPSVAEFVGEEDEEEAEIEHGLARDGLSKMLSMVAMPGFGAAAEMLLGGITHHVEEEENEILPALKEALPRQGLVRPRRRDRGGEDGAGQPVPQPKPRRSQKRKANSKR